MYKEYTVKVSTNGTKEWYLNGELHREDGPAVNYADGTKVWCLNGERHRIDGPAIEGINGYKAWYLNGERHREDGPAVENTNGYKEWWIHGVKCTEQWILHCMKERERDRKRFDVYIKCEKCDIFFKKRFTEGHTVNTYIICPLCNGFVI